MIQKIITEEGTIAVQANIIVLDIVTYQDGVENFLTLCLNMN